MKNTWPHWTMLRHYNPEVSYYYGTSFEMLVKKSSNQIKMLHVWFIYFVLSSAVFTLFLEVHFCSYVKLFLKILCLSYYHKVARSNNVERALTKLHTIEWFILWITWCIITLKNLIVSLPNSFRCFQLSLHSITLIKKIIFILLDS